MLGELWGGMGWDCFPIIAFAFIGSPMFFGNSVQAATIYVDQDGIGGSCSDSRDRTTAQNISTPICSPARGLAIATSGDTLALRKATYKPAATLVLNIPGLHVQSYNSEPVIVDFVNAGPVVGFELTADSIVLETLEIMNAQQECVESSAGATNAIIRKNHVHHCGLTNVGGKFQNCVDTDGNNTLIEGNRLHDSGSHLVYVVGNGITIRNNLIYKTDTGNGKEYGIQVGTGPFPDNRVIASHVTIAHNVIGEIIHRSSIVLYASGATLDTIKIMNNVLYDNAQFPIYIYEGTFTGVNEIRNNIYAGNAYGNCLGDNLSSGCITAPASFSVSNNQTFSSSNSLNWVDLPNHDFHLKVGSPAIDVALAGYASTDFDGRTRPIGSGPDIGPYEFTSGDSTAPAAPQNVRITP